MRRLFALGLMALVLALTPGIVHADPISVDDGTQVTGMAADSSRGAYWVSGAAGGKVQAISPAGKPLGTVRYQTRASSVQALSLSRGSLWIGDFVPGEDLRLIQLNSLAYGAAKKTQVWQLPMPAGAEAVRALMVSPKGNVYIATDGAKPGIYRASSPLKARGVNKLTRVADAPAGVTDGAFLPDGNSVVLRTAEQVVVIDAYQWTTTASAYLMPQPAGQALAVGLDGRSLLLADGASLTSMPLPTTISDVRPTPSAESSPSGGPSASIEPSPGVPEQAEESPAPSEQPSLAGTYTALGIALGVSLLAGLIVVVKR
ncbi:MAG: hypothetical protein Q3997_09240 [Propionibacteriaceae bacterium]|nr:hypothetical protein [Propionibacteriaceae bacterium]